MSEMPKTKADAWADAVDRADQLATVARERDVIRRAVLNEAADEIPPEADLIAVGESSATWLRARAKGGGDE